MRSEVFWTYSATEPLAVQDVASRANRSKGSVHYHTNELVRAGLLIAAGDRKSRSRSEKLYVRAGRSVFGKPPPLTDEYRYESGRGLEAILRSLARERKMLHRVWPHFPRIEEIALFRYLSLRLGPDDAALLRRRMIDLMQEFAGRDSPGGVRIRFAAIVHPDMGEMRKAHRTATGTEAPPDPED